ncbi:MAG: NnrU family protein [Sphingomonadales bacterium]
MTNLILALVAFLGTHFAMSHPLRAPLVARLGPMAFQGVYSLVALVTFVWVALAFRAAPYGNPLWIAGDGVWTVATVIMLAASILLLGSFVRNPAMPVPGSERLATQPARGVFAITRHPMMWSFALWSLAHVLVSPRPAVIVLSIGIAFLALVGAAGQDVKKAQLMGDAWRDWSSRTTYWPFAGQVSGRIPWTFPGMHALGGGLVVWLVATWAHPLLGSGMPAGIWRWLG